jgi:pheromone shutdown-related protein TraB
LSTDIEREEATTRIKLGDREIILIGTAHVSQQSVEDVERMIVEERPERVCVEIDQTRYKAMVEGQSWEKLNIYQVLREKKGFLLLANLVLSSFQRRLGADLGVTPGEEMRKAIEVSERENIPFSFSDREVHVTLRRAWKKSSFWGKNKMLAALMSSVFTKEKLSSEDIERLKKKSALQDMMEELAGYLPSVKEVLIDERDRYLATRIFETKESKVVAIVGAGHVGGITDWLNRLQKGEISTEVSDIDVIPPRSVVAKIIPWVIPAIVIGVLAAGFFRSGWRQGLEMLWLWIVVNGTLSAVGAILALAHPITILASFLAAPITSMNPTIGVGIVTGLLEAVLRKPRVRDFESLHDDMLSFKGFYKNRFTHILIVFFLSSVGSAVGTFIGIPWLTSLLAG